MKAELTLEQIDELWLLNDYRAKAYIYKKGWLKRTCKVCKNQYPLRGHSSLDFCSSKCSSKSYHIKTYKPKRYNKTCIRCSKSFTAIKNNTMYCSYRCCKDDHNERKRVTHKQYPRLTVCNHCNKEYTKVSYNNKCPCQKVKKVIKFCKTCSKKLDNGKKTYCSKACKPRKKRYYKPKTYPNKPCKSCGSHFTPKSINARYCSKKCHPSTKKARKKWKRIRDKRFNMPISRHFVDEICQIYENRPEGHHVDHIVPLNHKIVCGLHVPWNLQYLTEEENMKKSNKFNGLD